MNEFITWGGIVITVLVAYAAISRQQKAGLELQRDHLRNQLKLEIYRALAPRLRRADQALSRAGLGVRLVVTHLKLRADGVQVFVPSSGEINKRVFAALRRVTEVLVALEEHEIVFGRFASIQRSISDAHRDALDKHSEFSKFASRFLPLFSSADPLSAHPVPPSAAQLWEIQAAADELDDALGGIAAFMVDVRVEAQNELLGGLFENVVPPRRPGNPTLRVLSRDATTPLERPSGGRWV